MYKVSVIIPVYKVEKYIAQCLRSVLGQTLKELECILVDDCSPDASIDVARAVIAEFSDRAEDVKIIRHEVNRGAPQARRTGLDAASGQYVAHLDSDDWISPDCYEKMYAKALDTGADVVTCWAYTVTDRVLSDFFFRPEVPSDRELRIRDAITLRINPHITMKLVRREVIDKIATPPAFMADDWMMTVQLALADTSWTAMADRLYFYRKFAESGSQYATDAASFIRRMESEKTNVDAVTDILADLGLSSKYRREIEARKCQTKRLLFKAMNNKDVRRAWRSAYPEVGLSFLLNRYLPMEYKIKHLFAMAGLLHPAYSLFKKLTGKD